MKELKSFLQKEVKKVILQEKIKKGKIGRGGIKKKIKEAGALANDKPQELMKRLGVQGAPGGANDFDKVSNLIRSAIFGNETMTAAYGGAKITKIETSEDEEQQVVIVSTRKISERDGALYVLHTLTGAYNAGLLPGLKSELEVSVLNGMITVLFEKQ